MKELQVLVATMNQTDFSLAEQMNLKCDAVFANQTQKNGYQVKEMPYGTLQMISTATHGVGLNRNIALQFSDADIILFADDDITYYEGSLDSVKNAFLENPKADVIIFGIDIVADGRIIEKRHLSKGRLHCWNAMRFGTPEIAVRRKSILKKNITFHQFFGGGCIYGSGEDSLFLRECFRQGLRVYSHDFVLGERRKDNSTWFTGYHQKYFYDKGALIYYLFPKLCYLMAIYFSIHFKKKIDISCIQRLKLMFSGIKGGKKVCPYPEVELPRNLRHNS